jgi:hypothetical protein
MLVANHHLVPFCSTLYFCPKRVFSQIHDQRSMAAELLAAMHGTNIIC